MSCMCITSPCPEDCGVSPVDNTGYAHTQITTPIINQTATTNTMLLVAAAIAVLMMLKK